jgi:methyl-accepting chemotaxis protein
MYIRGKVSLVQTAVMAVSLFIILLIIYLSASRLVNEKDDAIYTERLQKELSLIASEYESLVKTGLDGVEAYVAGAQRNLLEELRRKHRQGKSTEVFLVIMDSDGGIVLHPTLQEGSKDLGGLAFARTMLSRQEGGSLSFTLNDEKKWMRYEYFTPWKWYVGFVVDEDFKYATIKKFLRLLIIVSIASLALVVAINLFTVKRLLQPLDRVISTAGAIARGDLAVKIEVKNNDEIGMALGAMNLMAAKLRDLIAKIRESAVRTATSAEQISAGSRQVREGAFTTSQASEATLTSMEEMAASIQSVARNADALSVNVTQTSSSVTEMMSQSRA